MNTMVAQRKHLEKKNKKMKHLFIDTETTGLPLNWRLHPCFFKTYPRIVTLSWRFYEDHQLIDQTTYVIQPEDYIIPLDASKIHGYTTERAKKEGVVLDLALEHFFAYVKKADKIIAHNASFDLSVIQAECYRRKIVCPLQNVICTMKSTIELCRIASSRGYKYPKLVELYGFLFGKQPEQTHQSDKDTELLCECFFMLEKRYPEIEWVVITNPEYPTST